MENGKHEVNAFLNVLYKYYHNNQYTWHCEAETVPLLLNLLGLEQMWVQMLLGAMAMHDELIQISFGLGKYTRS